jgi:16S rRNA (guanine966-N2)-methyltransferase
VTRIIAGEARGRRLSVPSAGTRPTSDRAREAVFSSVESILGSLVGSVVLDLYAGSGAMGLEALSRGAGRVALVEQDARACRVINDNIEAVGLPGAVCYRREVSRWLVATPPTSADLAFLDPPYDQTDEQVLRALHLLQVGGHLREGGIAVVERSARSAPVDWADSWAPVKDRRYGDAHLWLARSTHSAPTSSSDAGGTSGL